MLKDRRFSKAALVEELEARIRKLEAQYGFSRNDGWAQVKQDALRFGAGGLGYIDRLDAYGRYDTYWELLSELRS